jgi:2-polyprenyl-6-methoxyphenol hydroxylase-like FAD-dependent oxidoreductase
VLSLAPIAQVLAHINSPDQLTYASYADVRMPYWHDRQVVCIGDCAHATSPQLGQGANLALVDAMTLACCFSAGDSVPATLAAYSRKRKAHLRYYQGASKLLTPFFQSDSRAAGLLRDFGLGLVCRAPFARQQMARTLSGTKTGWLLGSLETVRAANPSTSQPAQMPAPPDSPAAR